MISYIILGVLALIAIWAIAAYNSFVQLTHRTKEAWADIDVQLKRRYDLIPNLVETVKGYAAHERETLDAVIAARAQASAAHVAPASATPEALAAMTQAEGALGASLGKVFALAENYPDLKANTNFLELQRELADTENKIQAARRFYNGNARDLKIGLESFPGNLISSAFHFKAEPFFELEASSTEREPVSVHF